MTAIRLAIIGAGSAQFSLGLVRDLCLTEALLPGNEDAAAFWKFR
jgi:alpha-galactosidase/6-phospho-beta-glucosidase family protein